MSLHLERRTARILDSIRTNSCSFATMIDIESFFHRTQFAQIVSRWVVDQPRPDDVMMLKRIINFNVYAARIWGDRLVRQLLANLGRSVSDSRHMRIKADLKDLVVSHPLYTNPRIDELRARYLRFPEDFYREAPIDGRLYTAGPAAHPHILGLTRIKRFRRIAEKGSRRIVQFLLARIRANADAMAEERAKLLGIDKSRLITPPQEMEQEFAHAERRLIKAIRQRTIQHELPVLSMPDVVGIKLIIEDHEYPLVRQIVTNSSELLLIEEQRHVGRYNAVNLRIAHRLPRDLLAAHPPTDEFLSVLKFRGLDPQTVVHDYLKMLDTAEEYVNLELIVANFQDFMESELGASMHEERILTQRREHGYQSHLATNVRALMTYMLTLCRAPGPNELDELPIKLWVRYMPDTFEQTLMTLFVPPDLYLDAAEQAHEDLVVERPSSASLKTLP